MELASARRDARAVRTPSSRSALTPGQVAWTAALPCGLITVAAVLLLGPPLAQLLPADDPAKFWPETQLAPEPVEHARFGIALLGPVLLALVATLGAGRLSMRPQLTRALAAASQLALAGLLLACVMAQNGVVWEASRPPSTFNRIFDPPLLAGAVLVTVAILYAARRSTRRGHRLPEETRALRRLCALTAAGLTIVWLLRAFNVETTIADAPASNLIPWDMGETFAVLDGRTPLVDLHSQYNQLLPFVAAAVLALVGSSTGAWTATMATLSALALLAMYGVFRRVVRHALTALALYIPFLAIGFFHREVDIPGVEYSAGGIFSAWPMRYGGAYLLAWLTARHLDGAAPRRLGVLFCVGALVAINNTEFGGGAFAGTLLAVACTTAPLTRARLKRLLAGAALGVLAAVALVSLVTLVSAGALPHFEYLLEFPHLYGVDGWVLEPMAPLGLHLAMYLTFAAATTLAVVRAVRGGEPKVLTGMLAWSGTFGLVAGSYYAGRSDPLNLITLFSAWGLALMLLAVPTLRAMALARRRLPTPAQIAVVFGCAVAVTTVVQVPSPWEQVARLRQAGAPVYKQRELVALTDRVTSPGEAVAILAPLGHRVAYDLRLTNVVPYTLPAAMPAKPQLRTTLDAIRRARVRTVVVMQEELSVHFLPTLERAGFAYRDEAGLALALTLREARR